MKPTDPLLGGVLNRRRRGRREQDGWVTRTRDGALAAYSLYQLGTSAVQQVRDRMARPGYTVAVDEDDELFNQVQRWLDPRVRSEEVRDLEAWLDQERGELVEWVLRLTNTTTQPQDVVVGGHRVTVEYEEPDVSTTVTSGGREVRTRSKARFVFTAPSAAGRDGVVDLLRELAADYGRAARPQSQVFICAYGSWEKLAGVSRSLDSVVLRAGVKERFVEDLRRFLDQEQRYADLGVPWHRGYLLHGPPGTGKSSLVKAVASHLGLDLYYAQLSDLLGDTDLTKLFNQVRSRSILLLEDVDRLGVLREAPGGQDRTRHDGVTLSGILNNLDGVVTPHGLISMLCVNHRERLDPALLRRGRIDLELEIDLLDGDQLRRLAERMLGEDPGDPGVDVEQLGISPAEVVEIVKQHLDKPDPQDALAEIRELVQGRRSDAGS